MGSEGTEVTPDAVLQAEVDNMMRALAELQSRLWLVLEQHGGGSKEYIEALLSHIERSDRVVRNLDRLVTLQKGWKRDNSSRGDKEPGKQDQPEG